jgi:hypothetical protein
MPFRPMPEMPFRPMPEMPFRPMPEMPFRPMPEMPFRPGFPSGPEFEPRITPADVLARVQAKLGASPSEALGLLRGQGEILESGVRRQLTEQVVGILSSRAETTNRPLDLLPDVRAAAQDAEAIDAGLGKQMRAVQGRLEVRALRVSLEQVSGLGEQGKWGDVARAAADPALAAVPKPAEVGQALKEVSEAGTRLESLARLEGTLSATERAGPEEAARLWRSLPEQSLPAELRGPARGLRGLAELRALAEAPGQAPDPARALQASADLEAGGGDGMLVRRAKQDLAVKAFLDGNAEAAKQLLPADGPPDHAGALLRDMKAVLLGEGQVTTWPAERALPPEAGGAGTGKRGPPAGPRGLIPEGTAEGWRPPLRESALEGLTPLEDAKPAEAGMRQRAAETARDERGWGERDAAAALHRVHVVHQQVVSQQPAAAPPQVAAVPPKGGDKDADEAKYVADVEAQLGRKLTPPERDAALEMKRAGRSPSDAARQLAKGGPDLPPGRALELLPPPEGK